MRTSPTAAATTDALEQWRRGTYPGTRPFGWYHLVDSDAVPPGAVERVAALGKELVVFRTEEGALSVLDAHCPHLGAHLGVGGKVVGDVIRCPFHGLRFRVDGSCAGGSSGGSSPRIRARAWPARELYGMVFVYHGPLGPRAEVPYVPAYWPHLASDRFVPRGRHTPRDVRMHLLEFAENSVDLQHFGMLHRKLRLPWTNVRVPWVELCHRVRWELDRERPHVAHFYDDAHLVIAGRDYPATGAAGHALFVGPASLVVFTIRLPRAGDVVIFQTHTPIDEDEGPLRLRVRFRWWAERTVPRLLTSYVVGNWISQWWRDVEVWENKIHVPRPLLTRGDGPLRELRSWFRQFYAESTPAARIA